VLSVLSETQLVWPFHIEPQQLLKLPTAIGHGRQIVLDGRSKLKPNLMSFSARPPELVGYICSRLDLASGDAKLMLRGADSLVARSQTGSWSRSWEATSRAAIDRTGRRRPRFRMRVVCANRRHAAIVASASACATRR
jgi:hypothetical protein